ncbi:MAG: alkaline phosphatase [Candidatus Eisenbacteria bacterium]
MNRARIGALVSLAFALAAFFGREAHAAGEAKNVILLIGDGMGPAQRTLAYYGTGKEPAMNSMPVVGLMSTEPAPARPDRVDVTDSAAAATALATGIKTYNEAISVDLARHPVPTILEAAKGAGKATGLVVTCQVNHATPACFAAHDTTREDYDAIAADYLTSRPDVILGGGTDYFLPAGQGGARADGRNLEAEFAGAGYHLVHTASELEATTATPLLGLFAPKGLAPAIDRDLPRDGALTDDNGSPRAAAVQPTLVQETQRALGLLSRDPDGFFLMVEGSQIDWGCHANDAGYALGELEGFDAAVAAAREFAARDRHTLVVVLADHETGGLALGHSYEMNLIALRAQKASAARLAAAIEAQPDQLDSTLRRYAGIDSLSAEERQAIVDAKKKAPVVASILSDHAGLLWASHDHSGVLIPVTADGQGASAFAGTFDNTEIPGKIARAMGIDFPTR